MNTQNESTELEFSKQEFFENLKWLNTKEAAAYLRISTNALRIRISRGDIIPSRLGRSLRFKREDLDKLMEAQN